MVANAPVAKPRLPDGELGVLLPAASASAFQLVHILEHAVQFARLLATRGDAERSHGVIG